MHINPTFCDFALYLRQIFLPVLRLNCLWYNPQSPCAHAAPSWVRFNSSFRSESSRRSMRNWWRITGSSSSSMQWPRPLSCPGCRPSFPELPHQPWASPPSPWWPSHSSTRLSFLATPAPPGCPAYPDGSLPVPLLTSPLTLPGSSLQLPKYQWKLAHQPQGRCLMQIHRAARLHGWSLMTTTPLVKVFKSENGRSVSENSRRGSESNSCRRWTAREPCSRGWS